MALKSTRIEIPAPAFTLSKQKTWLNDLPKTRKKPKALKMPKDMTSKCYKIPSISKCLEFNILPRSTRHLNKVCTDIIKGVVKPQIEIKVESETFQSKTFMQQPSNRVFS